MKYLLDADGLAHFRHFRSRNTLIAFDYDGTLAPIVARPEDARMRESTRALLARVARRYPVIVLTGRSRKDAVAHLSGVPLLEIIGSHGVDRQGTTVPRFFGRVALWRAELVERLQALVGVRIEDKGYSLSVHYRHSQDPDAAKAAIAEAAGALEGARVLGGKKVVNVMPHDAPDKGAALLTACERYGSARAIYLGDDDTDEDAFAAGPLDRILAVRVGESATSCASHYLRSQDEVDRVLELLLEA